MERQYAEDFGVNCRGWRCVPPTDTVIWHCPGAEMLSFSLIIVTKLWKVPNMTGKIISPTPEDLKSTLQSLFPLLFTMQGVLFAMIWHRIWLYDHDVLPVSTIFEGDLPSKPDKSVLIVYLENYLAAADMNFFGETYLLS